MLQPGPIADPLRPTASSYLPGDYMVIQRGEHGQVFKIDQSVIVSAINNVPIDWVAGDFVTGDRRQYHNLQIEALDDFTSSSVENELEAATPKWKVVGGVLNKSILGNETYIIPPNHTGIAYELTLASTSTVKILSDAKLVSFGAPDNSAGGTIEGADRIIVKSK